MHLAIDVDDTLTRRPDLFAQFVDRMGVSNITLLTGTNDMDKPDQWHQDMRYNQIRPLLPAPLPRIHICRSPDGPGVAKLKGEFCRDFKVDILIDDNPGYCEAVRTISPNTIVLQVLPK